MAKRQHAKEEAHEPRTKKRFHDAMPAWATSQRFWGIAVATLFILIALGVTIHLHSMTRTLPVAENAARSNLQQSAMGQIAAQIRQQYPTLPEASIEAEAAKQWEKYRAENAALIEEQERMLAEQIRAVYQYEAGKDTKYNQTYVLEMDPYLFWHQANNYAKTGSVCDPGSEIVSERVCIDKKRLAPKGTPESLDFHERLEAMMIRAAAVFAPNLDSLTVIFYLPVLLTCLAVIPAFFIGRRLAGNIGGFVAAILIATHPVLMNRTIAGFVDTDGYNFMFSLLATWLLFEALDEGKLWKRATYAALAGIVMSIFMMSASGAPFMLFVLIACFVGLLVYKSAVHLYAHERLRAFADVKAYAILFAVFVGTAGIIGSFVTGFRGFLSVFTFPFQYSSSLQAATSASAVGWPNILTTVAELNIPSLATIMGNLGGQWIVVLAAFGLFVTLLSPRTLNWKTVGIAVGVFVYYYLLVFRGLNLGALSFLVLFALPLVIAVATIFFMRLEADVRYAVFMMGWLLASFFAATKGIRFLLLGIPPFALGVGIAIGWIFIAVTESLLTHWKKPFTIKAIVGIVLLVLIFNPAMSYNPYERGKQAAEQQVPGMNDAWWDALRVIREETPPNTIITSWWDFGHWFRNIGERGVTFDGGSQDPQPGHWVGQILLTNDDERALGILRMLDCGQNAAYDYAHEHLDVLPAKLLIDELVEMNREEARARLAQTNLPASAQSNILESTHCTPPPAVFITSADMIGKAGVWGHFGAWDFKRSMAFEYQKLPQEQALAKLQELGFSEAEATETYYLLRSFKADSDYNTWISGWPGYVTQGWSSCQPDGTAVRCGVGVVVGRQQQGQVVIEGITFDPKNIANSTNISVGVYSTQRLGGASERPARVVVADEKTRTLKAVDVGEATSFNIGVLVHAYQTSSGTEYRVLLADPRQADSLFTQLYFLDGKFTDGFTPLVERVEPGGGRIIVWNVTWPED